MKLDPAFVAVPLTHRGLHDVTDGRPENSVEAIAAAIEHGYGIEIDLQLSKDGVAMVFHDYHLGRLTGEAGPVAQRTSAELAKITLTGGPTGVPTFDEVLTQIAGQVPLLVEIKDQDGAMGKNVGPLEHAAAKALENYTGPVAVMSFNPNSVAAFGAAASGIALGIVTSAYIPKSWAPLPASVCDRLREIPDYDRVGASFISHEAADLHSARVAELKSQGASVLCWTITSAKAEAEARKVAQGITFEGYLA